RPKTRDDAGPRCWYPVASPDTPPPSRKAARPAARSTRLRPSRARPRGRTDALRRTRRARHSPRCARDRPVAGYAKRSSRCPPRSRPRRPRNRDRSRLRRQSSRRRRQWPWDECRALGPVKSEVAQRGKQLRLGNQHVTDARPHGELANPADQTKLGRLEHELVAGKYLALEPRVIDTCEKDERLIVRSAAQRLIDQNHRYLR